MRWLLAACSVAVLASGHLVAQEIPLLTQPVNDFAGVIDPEHEQALDMLIRALQQATGDTVVVATVDSITPYASIEEYAVAMFENHGRGIGQKGRDNGLLIVLALQERQVRIEVGYDLEEFIPDGFAGETIRQYMAPYFRRGEYGAGLLAGTSRIVERIAERRNVALQGVPRPRTPVRREDDGDGGAVIFALIVLFITINVIAGRINRRGRRRYRYWGGLPWSGWHSGVGPFGGGFGGFGHGRGGFGGGFGGFGGFGGGRSGGGGASGSW